MKNDYTKFFTNFNTYFDAVLQELDNQTIKNARNVDLSDMNAITKFKGECIPKDKYDFVEIKHELFRHVNDWGGLDDVEIYIYLFEETFHCNESIADSFMLSSHGGYTESELEQIKIESDNCFRKLSYRTIRDRCLAEIEYFGFLGDYALLTFILELFNFDMEKAREFMISKYGGFSKTDATRFKSNYKRFQAQRIIHKTIKGIDINAFLEAK
ncbi:MAG: hypothetical protein A2084_01630 [Tenericutes bacterium GWC2_39_45]|nr:MAG: hypothetical protein A2Y43_03885 [Tenericutes bacterium GWA2_38_26]OHE31196.1 MAG: hypothetical protein A2084_01630 [Tenericutes bacterium GWC2_39_45]OHE31672.1 MAG: hypothetical protein A2009_01755 [Tenericutes bacterium GWD2_38_27]